jgi:hypothetical protein
MLRTCVCVCVCVFIWCTDQCGVDTNWRQTATYLVAFLCVKYKEQGHVWEVSPLRLSEYHYSLAVSISVSRHTDNGWNSSAVGNRFPEPLIYLFIASDSDNSFIQFNGSSVYFLILAHSLKDWWHEYTEVLHFYCMTLISDKNYLVQNWSAGWNRKENNNKLHEW